MYNDNPADRIYEAIQGGLMSLSRLFSNPNITCFAKEKSLCHFVAVAFSLQYKCSLIVLSFCVL